VVSGPITSAEGETVPVEALGRREAQRGTSPNRSSTGNGSSVPLPLLRFSFGSITSNQPPPSLVLPWFSLGSPLVSLVSLCSLVPMSPPSICDFF
jgi:hypothetical protein